MSKGGYIGGSTIIGYNSAAYMSLRSTKNSTKPDNTDTWASGSKKHSPKKSRKKAIQIPKTAAEREKARRAEEARKRAKEAARAKRREMSKPEREAHRAAKGRGTTGVAVVIRRGNRVIAEGTCADRLTLQEVRSPFPPDRLAEQLDNLEGPSGFSV